ncbi:MULTISPECIES: hypothetical protein [Streptomycetaceae]|uniref:Uncharacterized protein n=1 Tax=Streptantibioticus cattleyicolor (strain ATCC 35852 / DSM 46488 / JCM 4925 / NBRC 14057 / NRRL 8057) TaxID=1003195 RepID=F8K473_STREN|nr:MULTISPECIES: hypothetical protein [Streptomycetaceae]AEW92621.1 hypothetical protein SCATT_02500 [Streptantibioticus cattleyicolor NRRL 8057 = DSM 46488]MYS57400.1 hypothetical protein [Streptomyces sp. SID5468]CCB72974.1 protein of unknown function [Streptantibioticus cattleyicolor NRRL 8057 = DSM 46488]
MTTTNPAGPIPETPVHQAEERDTGPNCSDLLADFLGVLDRIETEARDGFLRRCGLATRAAVWR